METGIPIDVLDDLCSRFIINVPEEERKNLIRICFQIELAHWFYIDFYSKLKENRRICNLKEFATIVFKHVPFLQSFVDVIDEVIDEWKEYKYSVPTYGAVLLNDDLTHVLLVQSYCSKTSWGFPKGKINKGESPWQCAIREVLEETGFDIREYMDPTVYVEAIINEQTVRLYIITGISMDQQFEPKTRNEIKSFKWFPLEELPASKKEATLRLKSVSGNVSLFMVTPFVRKLREWVHENYGHSPRKAKSKRPRNKSCGDLDCLELKDCVTPDKKKQGKKLPEKDVTSDDFQVDASGHNSRKSFQNTTEDADHKVRRTLEYVMGQSAAAGPPNFTQLDDSVTPKKRTRKKIKILKKPESLTPSGRDLLATLFSSKEPSSMDQQSPLSKKLVFDQLKAKMVQNLGPPTRETLPDSPQSKSFGNIHHDKVLSSFARVTHKGQNRNYFLAHSPAADHDRPTQVASQNGAPHVPFVEISFSNHFSKNGARAWSNFKFDRNAIVQQMYKIKV